MKITLCQNCLEVIEYTEAEKVSTSYETCPQCDEK
ncbi:MAG TPA: GapA-binding peptide SR1P [Pseudogracilibacillus sp.]|nr:GapA-binding peptide SR1P [Pseudogracilibacillus sp.]